MTVPGTLIDIDALPNVRDVGGWPTQDGRSVRTGVLYRSTEMHRVAAHGLAQLEGLGLRTVFDLRTEAERAQQPDHLPVGAELVVCDVLADSEQAAPAALAKLLTDPAAAEQLLGGGRAVALFDSAYADIVSLPSALAAYRRLFTTILAAARRPALFHCTTGKDRTGWAAAATLSVLGVAETDVYADYLATNRDLLPALAPAFDRFAAVGGDPALLRPVLGVEREYLDTAFTELRARFGTIERYFSDGLGVDPDALRSVLLD